MEKLPVHELGNIEKERKPEELVPTIGSMVRSELKRGDLGIDDWVKLVEDSANLLKENLQRYYEEPLTVEVQWHGHAEIFINKKSTEAWNTKIDEETEEEYKVRTDTPVLSVWVD